MTTAAALFFLSLLWSGRGQEEIGDGRDLACDFQAPCRWRNGTNGLDDDLDWGIADQVVLDSWHSIPRSKDGLGDEFAFVRGSWALESAREAVLVSDVVPCQVGGGKLRFWFWKTSYLPLLEVCVRSVEFGTTQCLDSIKGIHRQEWVYRSTYIPSRTGPFQIVFRASLQHDFDIMGLDEISYEAQLCNSGIVKKGVEKPRVRRRAPQLDYEPHPVSLPRYRDQRLPDPGVRAAHRFRRPPVLTRREWNYFRPPPDYDYQQPAYPPPRHQPPPPQQRRPRPMLIVADRVEGEVLTVPPFAPPPPLPTTPEPTSPSTAITTLTSTSTTPPPTTTTTPKPTTTTPATSFFDDFFPPVSFSLFPGGGGGAAAGGAGGLGNIDIFTLLQNVAPLLPLLSGPSGPGKARDDVVGGFDGFRRPPPDYGLQDWEPPIHHQLPDSSVSADLAKVVPDEVIEIPRELPERVRPQRVVLDSSFVTLSAPIVPEFLPRGGGGRVFPSPPRSPTGGGFAPLEQFGFGAKQAQPVQPQTFDFEPQPPSSAILVSPEEGLDSELRSTGLNLPQSAVGPREWRVSDRQVDNSLTGIYTDASKSGMFAYAGLTDNRKDVFVLSTPVFTTTGTTRLSFNYYQAGVEGRLRVCLDDVTECPFESLGREIRIDSRNWRGVSIPVPIGTRTVSPSIDSRNWRGVSIPVPIGTRTGANFVFADERWEEKSILGFGSVDMLNFLRDSPEWYADAAFSVVPHHFSQLWAIHGVVEGFNVFLCSST